MRKLKFILSLITVVIIAFTSLSQLNSQNNPNMKKGFYLGPMSHYFLNVLETGSHHQWYQDLSYNMMQSYCAHLDTIDSNYQSNGQRDGGFFENTSNYVPKMRQVIENWHDIANDNSLIFEREKILRPAFGQRFTYQTDGIGGWHNKLFPAFGYDTSETGHDTTESWMGETVSCRRCVVGRDTAGFIVKGLYENCSQTNDTTIVPDGTNSSGHDRLYSDIKQPEYNMRWFIKPRMRIDSVYAKTHRTDTVVTVYVKNFKGNIIDSTSIICNNFLTLDGQGNAFYSGFYMERFLNTEIQTNDTANFLSVRADLLAAGKGGNPDSLSKVDYQVKWLGKVDVWLDHVRVDDSWAHYLFTDTYENEILPGNQNPWKFHLRIKEEVDAFANKPGLGYFWVDEVQYPNLECIGEVNKFVKQYSNNKMSLIFITDPKAFMGWPEFRAVNSSTIVDEANWDICINKAIDCGALSDIMITQWFPFYYTLRYPNVLSDISDTLHIYGKVMKADNYHQYTHIPDEGIQPSISWFIRQQKYFYKKAREKGLIYGVINQINSDEKNIKGTGSDEWGIREPTNEEISMLMHTSMAYGAKIMLEFSYTSAQQTDTFKNAYNWGLTSTDRDSFTHKRDFNYYGQRKWDFVANLNRKLKQIGNFMYPMGNTSEHLVHDYTYTVNDVTYPCDDCGSANHDYIQDIISYAPYNDISEMCTGSNMQVGHNDCSEQRYWELGFFSPNPRSSKPFDKSKYLYAVNKRTYPVNDTNDYGDIRVLKIMFKPASLTDFNNWVIKDAATNSVITYFNKSSSEIVSAGEFQPGEGKLLKIAPVMQEGGTFVCDEEVISSTCVCDSTVFNNGYDLRLYQGTTIKFNPKGKIVFSGGSFYSGILPQNSSPQPTEFIGNNCYWEGISFTGGTDIHISNSVFKNIDYKSSGDSLLPSQNCALSIINCNDITINSSQFYMDNKAGSIYYQYSSCENPWWENAYIGGNTFTISQSNINSPLVTSFSSLSAIETPIRLEDNYFNNTSGTSAIATAVNGVCGGTIKNNNFNNFSDGVIATNSSIDLYYNRFYSDIAGAKSIQGFSESNLNMSPNDEYYLGGYNRINTMNDESINIYVDNSYVFLENGENTFDISEYSGNGEKTYHVFGTFPSINEQQYPAAYNCFRIDNVDAEAFVDVNVNGTPIEFNFYPYSCNAMLSEDYDVVSIEGIVNDTIAVKNTGQGGSEKGNGGNGNELQVSRCKTLSDSINISIRKRQYTVTEQKCIELLNLFPDSTASIDALNKLYLSSLLQDSAGSKMTLLKTFYETIILNNQGKEKLINRCFYLIQKCKVSLKQYTSALEGFSLIIQQNPYTYEGLVASWDFAATHILDSIGGSSGGLTGKIDEKQLTAFDITDRYDSTKFTKKQRIEISKSVNDILESKRITQTEKIETLQKKSNEGNREAAKELHTIKRLSETVKTKKPGNNSELQGIIQSDIKKVFSRADNNPTESVSLIPQTYQLYQNYPNPFNPMTKIAFDLPKDAKVKLVIYDILGREMKTLVNNEFRSAGKYITEFNGSNMASGIYFARILANEGKDFMAVKKMVLLK